MFRLCNAASSSGFRPSSFFSGPFGCKYFCFWGCLNPVAFGSRSLYAFLGPYGIRNFPRGRAEFFSFEVVMYTAGMTGLSGAFDVPVWSHPGQLRADKLNAPAKSFLLLFLVGRCLLDPKVTLSRDREPSILLSCGPKYGPLRIINTEETRI